MIEVSVYYPVVKMVDEPSCDKVRVEFVLPKRPFLFWEDRKIGERIGYPRGYGLAYAKVYRDIETDRLLFAPIPFNIAIGFAIWLYQWLRMGFARWCFKHSPNEAPTVRK